MVDAPKPELRVLLVTFDLVGTVGGDYRYRQADDALRFMGEVFRPLKQNRFLLSSRDANNVRTSLEQRIGRRGSILVAPVSELGSWRIHSSKHDEWDRLCRAVRRAGLNIQGLNDDYVNL